MNNDIFTSFAQKEIKDASLLSEEVYSQVLESCDGNKDMANEVIQTLKALILPFAVEEYKKIAEDFVKEYPQFVIVKKLIECFELTRSMAKA